MAKKYTGSLSLDWYNKNRAIITQNSNDANEGEISAPCINWINKDESLFYEIDEEKNKGKKPYWVNRSDIRVKESRPLIFSEGFKTDEENNIIKINEDDESISNFLIKGDNLLALNTLKKLLDNRPEKNKVKCIYIDPPFNTGSAFEHYDDNLEHSEWLTLMRDRLSILHDLLRDDGFIFIHLDDKESAYCKVLMDEIFGRQNYCNEIIITTNKPFGFKSTSDNLFKQANHILLYAKNKELVKLKEIYYERDYDSAYNKVFLDTTLPEEKWQWENINEHVAKKHGYSSTRKAKKAMGSVEFESEVALFALNNSEKVFQTVGVSGGAYKKRKETIIKSKKEPSRIIRHPNDNMDYQFIGGRRVIYYSERLVEIDGLKLPGEIITDTWTDISFEGLSHEGGVDFPKGKKPEKLIERIFRIGSEKDDLVLDIFGGSGTTFGVAHKMSRKWIGVEIGDQMETHIIPRLKSILKGADKSGISKAVNWKGGGAFKVYTLGKSIIDFTLKDFNWELDKDFIEETLLLSYDFLIDDEYQVPPSTTEKAPKVGFINSGNRVLAGIVSLSAENDNPTPITNEYLNNLLSSLRKNKSPQAITIFTNRGVEMALDSKPDDVEIIKVPQAIFAELER